MKWGSQDKFHFFIITLIPRVERLKVLILSRLLELKSIFDLFGFIANLDVEWVMWAAELGVVWGYWGIIDAPASLVLLGRE